jgi:hypothetical protein
VVGSCEHGNETSGIISDGEFLDQLKDCQLLKEDSALWSYLVCAERKEAEKRMH